MNNLSQKLIPVSMALVGIVLLFSLLWPSSPFSQEKKIPLSELASKINQELVQKIKIAGNDIEATYQDGEMVKSFKEEGVGLTRSLIELGVEPEKLNKVEIEIQEPGKTWTWLAPLFLTLFPFLLLFFFFWVIFRQAKTGAMQTFDFTKARAKLFGIGQKQEERVTFNDVAGLKEAKEELKEVIDFLKNPQKYLKIGARIPKGVLLIGPPGCGKTLLARAIASEANVPFFSISGSEFIELFVGVGSSRVRSLFSQAKKAIKAIVFIDEIDSIGRARSVGFGGGYEEREQTLNQLLAEMDGFEKTSKIIVMGATNKPESLDSALLRPGRFDRRIVLDLPDIEDREAILKIHCRDKPLANVNLREIAERTPGFSGADLENLANEAAILTARRNKTKIFQEDFLESIEKVLLGPERKSHILRKKDKEIAAFHEAGHALVTDTLAGTEEVRKVSIVARGLAAGYTLKMPKEERRIRRKSEFLAEMAALLGGYVAEKLRFKEISTGAANDLKMASRLARKLVKEYGMSNLGPITFGEREELAFLGIEAQETRNYSEKIAAKIDREVSKMIKGSRAQAERVLKSKRKILEKLARVLIEKETIEKEEFERIVKSVKIR